MGWWVIGPRRDSETILSLWGQSPQRYIFGHARSTVRCLPNRIGMVFLYTKEGDQRPFPLSPSGLQAILLTNKPISQPHMKPYPTRLTILALSALAGFAAHAAELETNQPVAAKTNEEKWWNGNCERILDDIKKMDGKIDVGFVGDSMHDSLHLAPKGYDIWAEAIGGKVKELLGGPPSGQKSPAQP